MDRRTWLQGSMALSALAFTANAAAQSNGHAHHHEAGRGPYDALIASAAACVQKGQLCLTHTLVQLGQGDKALAACAASVRQTISLCVALGDLAAQNAPHVPALAALVKKVCKECEDECRKHKEHPDCLACADACADCIKQCAKVAA
jgi:Cys-rich four helix bundle protein (predicted Tat secretion target)